MLNYIDLSMEDKFTLSYSKKEHNRKRGGSPNEIDREDLVLNYDGSVDNMKHFVGPAFIMCKL